MTVVRLSSFVGHKPTLTEANLPDQFGKVFIVTGASGGLGKELAQILYQRNGKVYMAARSLSKTSEVMKEIQGAFPDSKGELVFLPLVLDDLTTIKASAEEFLSKESRLDVLYNNAGVMVPPQGSKTVQGYELQLGINNIAPFLFTNLLRPALAAAARVSPKDSVRVIWVSSSAADGAPTPPIDFDNMDYHIEEGIWNKYMRSKAGNVLHAVEFSRRTAGEGIISLALHPGNFMTNLQQTMPKMQAVMFKLLTSEPKNGAYTQLFASHAPEITVENNGFWVAPYGKVEPCRKDLLDADLGKKYWEWTEEQARPYM